MIHVTESAHASPRQARVPAFGKNAVVVSGHVEASLAGISVLRNGGNVVDALIAASAALAVVLGHATSLGGDCFALLHDSGSTRTFGLNGSGTAPEAATPDCFAGGIDTHGARAPVVPGLVRSWDALHRRFGRWPWKRLFHNAIELAEAHVVSRVLATQAARYRERLAADTGCASLYLPRGRPIEVGTCLRQPALAATLRAIASGGADDFYTNEIARTLGAFFEQRGGLIRALDLTAYKPLWVDPISAEYRDHRVEVMPPNSYGTLLLMQLSGLAALDGPTLMSAPHHRLGYQMSAMQAAVELGASHIADPAESGGVAERLLGPETVAVMREAVLRLKFRDTVRDHGGTACVLVADANGTAACMVQSVFNVFGSAILEPRTGILFNNRMQGFDHRSGRPNTVGPGKRPAHTLCPVIVLRDQKPCYVLASPGGISQTLINAQVLMNLIDGGTGISAAVEAPRWCTTSSGEILIEPEFSPAVVTDLAKIGFNAKRLADDYFYGSAKAIEFLPTGGLAGAADHRREAHAIGF